MYSVSHFQSSGSFRIQLSTDAYGTLAETTHVIFTTARGARDKLHFLRRMGSA
jgi:hypothetical protein